MTRSWWIATFAGMLFAAGCNSPVCGKNTKQHQKANGEVECIPVDAPAESIQCDVDGGATIVAGRCVSAVTCGPNTKLENGVCVGTGGGGAAHMPEPCSTPATGKICINGVVRHLVDGSFLAPGEMVRVAVYDPLRFLNNPATPPLAEQATGDTYLFKDVTAPGIGLVALAVTDPTGTATPVLAITGAGAVISPGLSYRVDTYATPLTAVDGWTAASGGINYTSSGAYVALFYKDAAPMPTNLAATESMPASGITILRDGTSSPMARYLDPTMTMINSALTATGPLGAALMPGTGDASIPTFSGMGGGITWEAHPGNTTRNVVFVTRFHPM